MVRNLLSRTLLLITLGIVSGQSAAIAEGPYIDSVQGRVELKRKTAAESGFQVIKRGPVPLSNGDQVQLSSGAVAKIVCPGKKALRAVSRSGERLGVTALCPEWKARIRRGPPPLGILSGTDSQTPYLISPRRTLVLTPTPTLRWNPVPGVTQYTVQVSSSQGVVWQTQVQNLQLTYPGTPPLQPGIPYRVTIQINTGKSSQGELGSEFILLRDSEAKTVQAEVSQIIQSDVSRETKTLKLVDFYNAYEVANPANYSLTDQEAKNYRLNADAIATLEDWLQSSPSLPIFYRLLGDLYAQTGVMRPAEQAYFRAIGQIQSLQDLEEWTLAMAGLGELYEATKETSTALIWYDQAKAGFRLLDDQRAEALSLRINKLRKTTGNLLKP